MTTDIRTAVRDPLWIGGGLLLLLCGVALLGPSQLANSPWDIVDVPFHLPFSSDSPMGSDALGRDVLTGLIYGARVSLAVGLTTALVVLVWGAAVGAIAGYFEGYIDSVLSSVIEFYQTIPTFVFALVVVAILKPSIITTVVAISIVSWPPVARVVRAEVRSLKRRDFVSAALLAGERPLQIVMSELMPNLYGRLATLGALVVANAILMESAISFVGLGDPNVMTWGYMVGAARSVLLTAWWLSVIPSIAITVTVLAVHLLADGIGARVA